MEKKLTSPLDLSFFGLTSKNASEYRVLLFKQIHEITFHGNGGYSWLDIYNMPRWLRLFTFKEIEKYYKKQNDEVSNTTSAGSTTLITPDGKINPSAFPKVNSVKYK